MRHLIVALFAFAALIRCAIGQEQEKKIAHILIKNIKIFGGTNEQLRNGPVLIESNLISSIRLRSVPDGAIEIDGKGGTVVPKLIDMHAAIHEAMLEGRDSYDQMAIGAISREHLRDYLNQGFTTTRDAGRDVSGSAKAVRPNRIVEDPKVSCLVVFAAPSVLGEST